MKRSYVSAVTRLFIIFAVFITAVSPNALWACACGCGMFDVGTSVMFPSRAGGMVFLDYDHQDQNKNWSGSKPSSADNNDDKRILTNFFTLGFQYMFNRQWGISGELPYWDRYFKTTDDATGEIVGNSHDSVGDIRIKAIYTGLSDDMSTGLTFGLKLPTGDFSYPGFDRDTSIGTGSTDLLLGIYHMGYIPQFASWNWFLNGLVDQPVLISDEFRPGSEFNAAAGAYYNGWHIGRVKIAPLAQVIESYHWRDSGLQSDSDNSGYERVILSPGLELKVAQVSIYTDVGFPVLENANGNQLVASEAYKLRVSYHF